MKHNKSKPAAAPAQAPKQEAAAPAVPTATPVVPVAAATPAPVEYYTVVPPKRPLTGTHFGNGNAFMHTKLCEVAKENGGQLTWEQITATCSAVNHRSFASYALNRLKVLKKVVSAAATPTPNT